MLPALLFTLTRQTPVKVSPVVPPAYAAPIPAKTTVVAKVNGHPIKASDVEALLWEWRGPEVTEDLISLLLVRELAVKEGVVIKPSEVIAKVAENLKIAEEQKKANPQDPSPGVSAAVALTQQGYPTSRLYVRSEIEVTIDKVALKRFKPATFIKVSTMIFRTSNGSADAVATTAKLAQDAYDRLQKGETWDKVLETSKSDQQMAKVHGLLGWRAITAFPVAMQPTIKGLKPGGFTQPYQLPAGFQIFRVEAHGADAKDTDLTDLKTQFITRERQEIVSTLRSGAKIERFPTKEPGKS